MMPSDQTRIDGIRLNDGYDDTNHERIGVMLTGSSSKPLCVKFCKVFFFTNDKYNTAKFMSSLQLKYLNAAELQ